MYTHTVKTKIHGNYHTKTIEKEGYKHMDDMETKLELMQEEIDLLGDCVKSQTKTINSLLEIVKSLKDYLTPDTVIPDNIVYINPKDRK